MTILDVRSRADNKVRASPTEGSGGGSGILLSLDMVPTNYNAVAYTVPVQVGSSQQNLSLQVDTGSSDLWIASKSCPSTSCAATSGHLYDPSSSQSTGATFTIQYLSGTVSGPIVWDQVQIGGYLIPDQALAAATTVDEPLSYNFDGILGLSLPSNSLIQQMVPASTDGARDGAVISSNLFSHSLATVAPSQPFFSLSLGRPGFTHIPSLLGIGLHPSEIVPDPSQIRYSSLVGDSTELLFWKTTVHAITVYVNGQAHPVALQSLSGASEPTALLDSGMPLIITTPTLANGIYGALGIGPAPDGNYYVPCATPLNMTITLDGQNELPLHPLDLTMEPAGQSDSQYCTGLIQTDSSKLTASSDIGDIILGVPFMRNVYTVMAYEQPDATGKFNTSFESGNPMLGLLGLTNATQALEEFNDVRVLKQPLGSGSSQSSSSPQSDGSRFSVGVKVLIGLVGFFFLCLALFALRCFFARRRLRNSLAAEKATEEGMDQGMEYGAYRRTRRGSRSSFEQSTLVNTTSRCKDEFSPDRDYDMEFGTRKSKLAKPLMELDESDPWDPHAGTWRDTIVGTDAGEATSFRSSSYFPPDPEAADIHYNPTSPHQSLDLKSALMAHDNSGSRTSDAAEFGMNYVGLAGIGTAARGSIIDAEFQHYRPSYDSMKSSTPLQQAASSSRFSRTPSSPRESVPLVSDVDRTL